MKILISTFAMAIALASRAPLSQARAQLSRTRKIARRPARYGMKPKSAWRSSKATLRLTNTRGVGFGRRSFSLLVLHCTVTLEPHCRRRLCNTMSSWGWPPPHMERIKTRPAPGHRRCAGALLFGPQAGAETRAVCRVHSVLCRPPRASAGPCHRCSRTVSRLALSSLLLPARRGHGFPLM